MNHFSIRDIEMLSGIKAHTFRVWEQRHGLYFSKRKDSQHRYYDNDDLKAVLRISYLYHRGYKISKIATFTKDEIIQLASSDINNINYDFYVTQLIESTLDYDQDRFEKLVNNAIMYFGFEKSIIKVFYAFMQKVGLLWVTEHLIPAQEHFTSALIRQKILVAIDQLNSPGIDKKDIVLMFTPEKELHEIPLLTACYLFKKNGIRTRYFGVNIPITELEEYCSHEPVTHLYFHVITNFLYRDITTFINELLIMFPGKKIIASGPSLDTTLSSENVTVLRSIDNLVNSDLFNR